MMEKKDKKNKIQDSAKKVADLKEKGKSVKEKLKRSSDKKLQKKIDDLTNKNQDLENKLKRALADYQNLQIRVEKQRQSFMNYAKEEVLLNFLPVLDNLERAVQSIEDEGIQLVADQFNQVLEKQGLEPIGGKGEEFDPYKHECIEVTGQDQIISEVLEKGFKLGEKVIKVAKVKVGLEAKS